MAGLHEVTQTTEGWESREGRICIYHQGIGSQFLTVITILSGPSSVGRLSQSRGSIRLREALARGRVGPAEGADAATAVRVPRADEPIGLALVPGRGLGGSLGLQGRAGDTAHMVDALAQVLGPISSSRVSLPFSLPKQHSFLLPVPPNTGTGLGGWKRVGGQDLQVRLEKQLVARADLDGDGVGVDDGAGQLGRDAVADAALEAVTEEGGARGAAAQLVLELLDVDVEAGAQGVPGDVDVVAVGVRGAEADLEGGVGVLAGEDGRGGGGGGEAQGEGGAELHGSILLVLFLGLERDSRVF